MEETIYLIAGIILLLLVFYDFFYTTLSARGAAFITKNFSIFLHRLLKLSAKIFGRKAFKLSGVWVNLPVLTLRLRNSKPSTPLFEILTSSFSLPGFGIITTSMIYFISVSSAVIEKRSISLLIRNPGKSPQKVVQNLLEMKEASRGQQFTILQQAIDRHSFYHQSYPVIHFYSTAKKESPLSVNLAVMDEALSMLLLSAKLKDIHTEIQPPRKSIITFLDHVQGKYKVKTASVPAILWQELKLSEHVLDKEDSNQSEIDSHRKILGGLLKEENWSRKGVYPESVIEEQKQ